MYAQLKSGASIVETVTTVNAFLCSRVSGQKYVTLVAVHYKHGGAVELVNGGHVSPVLIHPDGRTESILDGDVPVGLLCNATFHAIPLNLQPGARLVLLSDGVTEAEDPAGIQFGSTEIGAQTLTATRPHPRGLRLDVSLLRWRATGGRLHHARDRQHYLARPSPSETP